MTDITRLKVQTAGFVALSIWNFATPIISHTDDLLVLSASGAAFFVLTLNNLKTIRREQEGPELRHGAHHLR
jgi:hypothetical protein